MKLLHIETSTGDVYINPNQITTIYEHLTRVIVRFSDGNNIILTKDQWDKLKEEV